MSGLGVSEAHHQLSHSLTDFREGQNADLPERLFDVFSDGNERSQNGLRERYPTCSGCVIRRSQLCANLDNCSNKFDDLLFLDSEFVVP